MSSGNEHARDPIATRQALADSIASQVQRQGYFLAHLDSEGQELIDLEWAALLAGRALGRKTKTYVTDVSRRVAGKVTVVVGPRHTETGRDTTQGYLRLLHAVLAQPA